MKLLRLTAVTLAAPAIVAMLAPSSALATGVIIDRAEAGKLVRITYSVDNTKTLTATTSNCGGSEDTLLYLLQGNASTLVTRATTTTSEGRSARRSPSPTIPGGQRSTH